MNPFKKLASTFSAIGHGLRQLPGNVKAFLDGPQGQDIIAKTRSFLPKRWHLVLGSGGTRAVLSHSGFVLACEVAGIKRWQWETVGGVSGGSIIAAMVAQRVDPRLIVKTVISTDFTSLVTPKINESAQSNKLIEKALLPFKLTLAIVKRDCHWKLKVKHGIFVTDKLRDFIEELTPRFPGKLWTIFWSQDKAILCTANGVFELDDKGHIARRISAKPTSAAEAVRGSCIVPGMMQPAQLRIEDELFLPQDGALGPDGRCPIKLPGRLFNADRATVLACDVGIDPPSKLDKIAGKTLVRWMCNKCQNCGQPDHGPQVAAEREVLVKPNVKGFRALEFALTPDMKWQAIMAGFIACIEALELRGVVPLENLTLAQQIIADYEEVLRTAKKPTDIQYGIEDILASHGLFEPDARPQPIQQPVSKVQTLTTKLKEILSAVFGGPAIGHQVPVNVPGTSKEDGKKNNSARKVD